MQPIKTAEKGNHLTTAGPGMESGAETLCVTAGYFTGSRLDVGHT